MTDDQIHDDYNSAENRLKRIETALYLLCRHLGVDPRTGVRLTEHVPHQTYQPKASK